MSKPIHIVSATRGLALDTQIYKSIKQLESHQFDFEYTIVENNIDGLPKVYNRFLTQEMRGSIVVFVHDDVLIEDLFVVSKLRKAHEVFNVVGLAGGELKATVPLMGLKSPARPALWHLMVNKNTMSGNVMHTVTEQGHVATTVFGAAPRRTQIMDGLFLSVDVDAVLGKDLKFDEQFEFHHYDIDFTLSCADSGLKNGTWSIHVTHASPGLRKFDERFMHSEEKFIKKWGK